MKTKGKFMIALVTLNYKDEEGSENVIEKAINIPLIDKIIVVDNFSNDGSYENLKKYEDDKIKIIQTGYNGGYSYGYNKGFQYIKELDCEYAILCNSDVLINRELIQACISFLEKHQECGGVSTRQMDPDGNELPSAWSYPSYWNEIRYCFILMRRFFTTNNVIAVKNNSDYEYVDALAGNFTCYRIKNLLEVGMYDENVFLYNEENIIGKRMAQAGFKLARLNNFFYIHNHRRKNGQVHKSFKELVKIAECSYYFQREYNNIGFIKKMIFKMSIYAGSIERIIADSITIYLKKQE